MVLLKLVTDDSYVRMLTNLKKRSALLLPLYRSDRPTKMYLFSYSNQRSLIGYQRRSACSTFYTYLGAASAWYGIHMVCYGNM